MSFSLSEFIDGPVTREEFDDAIKEAFSHIWAIVAILDKHGLTTPEDFDVAYNRASASIDQNHAEAREQSVDEFVQYAKDDDEFRELCERVVFGADGDDLTKEDLLELLAQAEEEDNEEMVSLFRGMLENCEYAEFEEEEDDDAEE